MQLEELIAENTAAVKALTAAHLKSAGVVAGTGAGATPVKGATGGKPAGGKTATKPKHTFEQVTNAVMEVKNSIDKETAKSCIEGVAGVGVKLAEVANTPQHFDAIVAACKEQMENADEPPADDEDDV